MGRLMTPWSVSKGAEKRALFSLFFLASVTSHSIIVNNGNALPLLTIVARPELLKKRGEVDQDAVNHRTINEVVFHVPRAAVIVIDHGSVSRLLHPRDLFDTQSWVRVHIIFFLFWHLRPPPLADDSQAPRQGRPRKRLLAHVRRPGKAGQSGKASAGLRAGKVGRNRQNPGHVRSRFMTVPAICPNLYF